jgi:hypothetical protein
MNRERGVACCMCGAAISESPPDPLKLHISGQMTGEQTLYCHAACLRRAVNPAVPLLSEVSTENE